MHSPMNRARLLAVRTLPTVTLIAAGLLLPSRDAAALPPAAEQLRLPPRVSAPWPAPTSLVQPHPEQISVKMGEGEEFEFSHARAFVHAPLIKVLEAFQQPDVLVDRRRVTEWKVTKNIDTSVPFSFLTHYTIRSIVTVEMPIKWRGLILQGTLKAPEVVSFSSEKVGGTSFVSLLQDSIVARAVDANTTSIEFVRQAKGMRYGKKDCAQYQQDLFQSILAFTRGQPLPKYE